MNCRQARIDLALCVGEDLPDAARRESLRQHVAQCPGCRAHYKRLRGTLQVLESSDRDRTYEVGGSLWPQLATRIRRMEESPGPSARFNGWLPFVAVTAACALLVVVIDLQAPNGGPAPHTHSVARDILGGRSILPTLPPPGNHDAFLPAHAQLRRATELSALEPDSNRTEQTRPFRTAEESRNH